MTPESASHTVTKAQTDDFMPLHGSGPQPGVAAQQTVTGRSA
jgi:hypothetical protein